MRFVVSFEGQHRTVELDFGTPKDIPALVRWRATTTGRSDPQVLDALEFRKLATKRWRYYLHGGQAAGSLSQLRQLIRKERNAEIGFLLLARARWHSQLPILGCCFCRRSWCHHFIVDFLAVHPKALRGLGRVRGVGTGMIYALVGLADKLSVATIWGETTKNSAPFYKKILNLPSVSDHFFVQGKTLEHCRTQYRLMC